MRNFLHERASGKLYHFIEFINFYHLVKTNCFTPTDWEKEYNNGKNSMSFSRTGSFHEGFPVLMYSEDEGRGDDWCAIRLTINGDLMNRYSNFKVDGKQYNMKFKPFDYMYKAGHDGDADFFYDNYSSNANNGKEWMMKSDGYTASYFPTNHEIPDPQGHPYSQAEDRLTTYASKIPNAERYVDRVDILLLTRNFSDYNYNDRLELYKLITSSVFSNKIHVYTDMKQLERRSGEISGNNLKRILTFKTTNKNMKKKIKLTESQLNKIVKESLNRILSESNQKSLSDDGYIVLYTDDMYVYDNNHSFLLRDICKAEYGDDWDNFSNATTFELAKGLKMDVEHYATLRDLVEHELKDVVYQCIDSVVEDRGFYMSDIDSTILPLWNKAVEKNGWVYIPLQRPVAVIEDYNEANALNEVLNDEASLGIFKWDTVNVGDKNIRVTLDRHSDYVNPSFE